MVTSSFTVASGNVTNGQASGTVAGNNAIPFDDIQIPSHLEPPNPEDEDEVVPNQHAAFGITKAMAARDNRERQWRDFDSLTDLVRGVQLHARDGTGEIDQNEIQRMQQTPVGTARGFTAAGLRLQQH